jgi:acetyltransferase-like isoleucine patch superfamily enzyme
MNADGRTVPAVHGRKEHVSDPPHERELVAHFRAAWQRDALQELYGRFVYGEGAFDAMMRRVLWRALARRAGEGLRVERGAQFRHIETFELGDGVFIGEQAVIHGRFDGSCVIGAGTWVGPQVFLDARALTIGESVGLGPGMKVLGSVHTGEPADVPIVQTDLEIRPVRVGDWADVGVNAVVMPGVTIGKGAIIGAGAVVTKDVPAFAVSAGVPAVVVRQRESDG